MRNHERLKNSVSMLASLATRNEEPKENYHHHRAERDRTHGALGPDDQVEDKRDAKEDAGHKDGSAKHDGPSQMDHI